MISGRTKIKFILCIWLALTTFPHLAFLNTETAWQKLGAGLRESEILRIYVHPTQPNLLFASTAKGLYRSLNSGREFALVLKPQGSASQVNHVFISPENPQFVWAATDSGLYQSKDQGQRWEQIFYSPDTATRRCQTVLADNDTIYVGTLSGLFYRSGNSSVWQRGKDILDNKAVFLINKDEYYIYFATTDKIYRLDKETNELNEVFSLGLSREEEASEAIEDEAVTAPQNRIKDITILPTLLTHIYLLTTEGVYHSTDFGETWDLVRSGEIDWEETTSLVVLYGNGEHEFIIGTSHGVVNTSGQKVSSLYKGMEATEVFDIANDRQGKIYAAGNRGVFVIENAGALAQTSYPLAARSNVSFPGEPTIQEVHHMAIQYAEADLNKIKHWRRAARNKALLPSLSVGLDRSSTDYFHWDTGANPDNLLKGRDYLDWDVSLSWDLGELIWNDDQTSIDSRSKLMVELREDVLDQVTRLYFERRRLQMEFLNLANSQDQQLLTDRQLRLEELTALLDGFTGGGFSASVKKNDNID